MDTPASPSAAREPGRARLCRQLIVAAQAATTGRTTITSSDLARHAPGAASRIRRELRGLGVAGKRGVGYDVASLLSGLGDRLSTGPRRVALVGGGELGTAIVESELLREMGVEIACVVDPRPEYVGRMVERLEVMSLDRLAPLVGDRRVDAGVIATPAWAARCAYVRLSAAGVPLVVSFADVLLELDGGPPVHHALPGAGLLLSLARSR